MTNRDRAALVLAYASLRAMRGDLVQDEAVVRWRDNAERSVDLCVTAFILGASEATRLLRMVTLLLPWERPTWRLQRARLALLLRVVLRVEAIEREEATEGEGWASDSMDTRVVCSGCGERVTWNHGELMTERWNYRARKIEPDLCPKTGRIERARNAIPLWEQASQHRSEETGR